MAHTLLVVDDDQATREAMVALLGGAGYEILTACDVPSALHILRRREPDLLITDVRLDAYNGLQLIATAARPIPAIVVTGFDDASIERDAKRMGAEYCVKPINPAALRALVVKLLEAKEPPAAFTSTRRAPRDRLATPIAVRVGQQPGRIIDVSATGMRLEVDCPDNIELPDSPGFDVVASGMAVPVRIAWQRKEHPHTWVYGVSIPAQAQEGWQILIATLT